MAASVAQFAQVSDWFSTTTPKSVTGVSWSAGDKIIVVGGIESAASTLTTPTNANLTFGLENSQTTGGSSEAAIYVWSAVAATSQSSQTIQGTLSGGALQWGLAVIVITGTDGTDANGQADLTESAFTFTPTAGSVVVYAHMEFLATAGKTITTGTGTATERLDQTNGTNYAQYIGTWENVTASSASFGITSYTGTQVARAVIEVKASAAAAVSGTAFFRPGKTWKRRYRHPQRLYSAPVVAADIRADTGLGSVGLSADATVKKVAVVSAISSLGLSATPVAKKVSKSTGIGAAGLASTVTARKVAPATGLGTVGLASIFTHVEIHPITALATVGLTSTSTTKKVTPAVLSAPMGLAGVSTANKVSRPSLVATAGLAGLVTARKVAPVTGRGVLGLQANFVHAEIHPITAIGALGLTSTVTEKKRLTPIIVGTLGLTGNALPKKISKSTGLGELPLVGLAIVRKKQNITGRSCLGLAAWWEIVPIIVGGDLYVADRPVSSIRSVSRETSSFDAADRTLADVGAGSRGTTDLSSDNRKTTTLTGG